MHLFRLGDPDNKNYFSTLNRKLTGLSYSVQNTQNLDTTDLNYAWLTVQQTFSEAYCSSYWQNA